MQTLHIPLPMNVANACYHSLLGDNISFLVFKPSRLYCKQQTLGWEVMVMRLRQKHTKLATAVLSIPDGTSKYTDELNFDFQKYWQMNQPCSWVQN